MGLVGMTSSRPPVLLVVDSLQCGGAERHVVDLARAIRESRHDVTVACSVAGDLAGEVEDAGARVAPLMRRLVKRRFSAPYAGALRGLIGAGGFRLVHGHIHASATAAAAAVAGTGVPLVVTEHTEAPWRRAPDRWIGRIAYRRADHVITVSSAIRRQLLGQFGVPTSKVTYVPNAVTAWAGPAGAVSLPAGCERGPLIGRVCRLAPEKGLDVFVRAAAAVAARAPSARFLVAGEGPCEAELRELAAKLGVDDRVHFLGHREDARALIARLDMLVVSSITDGAPLVILEAMAAGTPIVASACGGIPDQIRHEEDGILVPPADPGALAAAILRLVEEPALAVRLGDCGQRRASAEFSYEAMLARVQACYVAAARRRTTRAGPPPLPVAQQVQAP